MRINGIGVGYLNLRKTDKPDIFEVEEWFTLVYVPLLPLNRLTIRSLSNDQIQIIQKVSWTKKQIALGFLKYWVGFGFLILGPLVLKDIAFEFISAKKEFWDNWSQLAIFWFIGWLIGLTVWGQWKWIRVHRAAKNLDSTNSKF